MYITHLMKSIQNSKLLFDYHIGGHLGRDKTYEKIAARFYWKSVAKDVKEYVQHCETCQRTNDAKLQKQSAPLHPIPVKPKVWNQVGIVISITKDCIYSYCHEILTN